MDVTLVRIIVPMLAEAAAQSSVWFEFFKVLFQGFITAFFGLLFALRLKHVWFDAEKTKKENNERALILEELKDLERHFKANRDVVNALIAHNDGRAVPEMPSLLHARQLHVPQDYFILRKESLHGLSSKYTSNVSLLNVVLRNRNIEAQLLEDILVRPGVQWDEVLSLLNYMHKNFDRVIFPELNRCRRALGDTELKDYVHPAEVKGYVKPPREVLFQAWPQPSAPGPVSKTVSTVTTTTTKEF